MHISQLWSSRAAFNFCHQHSVTPPCLFGMREESSSQGSTGWRAGGGDPAWPWDGDSGSWARPGSAPGCAQTSAALPGTAPIPAQVGLTGSSCSSRGSFSCHHPAAAVREYWSTSEGFRQAGKKIKKKKKKIELQREINLSALLYGYSMLSIQQELVEVGGDGKALNFYKSCTFCGFDLHLAEGGS